MLTDRDDVHRLVISGDFGAPGSRLHIRGRVNLLPAEILLADSIRRLRGVVGVDAILGGTFAKPYLEGALYPAGVLVRAQGLGGDLVVRAGRVKLDKDALVLEGVRLQVVDEESEVSGRVTLDGLRPRNLDLAIKGWLSPRALELALGDAVVRPKGEPSRMNLRVVGTIGEPVILGNLHVGKMQMGLKSASQDLALQSGRVEFRHGSVKLHDLRGKLDEGAFTVTGDLFLRGFALDGVDLHLVGENIPHRSGGVYEVEVSPDLRLTGRGDPASGYSLAGVIDVVEGRYIQKFDVNPVSRLLSPSRTSESSGAFYEGSPLLENLQLNLTITSTGTLRVKNNVADVGLEGDLTVTGTLPDMKLGGTVDIKDGTFRVPYLRGRYSGATGSIDFDRGRGEGKNEPYVFLEGATVHTDRSETDHEITLTIQGYLSKLAPTWSSSTGLTSSQVLTLLVTSRTPDELRKGRSAALPNLAPLIEDYIPMDLQLDLSSDAVQVFVERKLGRFFRLKGEGEFGYSGSQRQEGIAVFRVTDNLSLEGRVRRRVQGEDVTEEDDTVSGRVEAKYKIQLQGGLRRSLGL
jgi:autotransporter translocation and assembly factor TamB